MQGKEVAKLKVTLCWIIHGYTILTFDSPLPFNSSHVRIDGVTYPTLIVYDMKNSIGIKAEINAEGKEVEFY
jgi:hypothetical protein